MDPRCHETREMAADLALGIVYGEERGRALQHLADCPDCRAEVEKYSDLADELLLLAPQREAPVGFESRVNLGKLWRPLGNVSITMFQSVMATDSMMSFRLKTVHHGTSTVIFFAVRKGRS